MRALVLLLAAVVVALGDAVNPLDIDEGAAPVLTTVESSKEAVPVSLDAETDVLGFKNATETDADAVHADTAASLAAEVLAIGEAGSMDAEEMPEISIDEVEAHVHLLQQLELSVAKSLAEMNRQPNEQLGEAGTQLRDELMAVQQNLQRLASGLNGTLLELEHVERDTEEQSKKLREVLEQQKEEEQEQFIEENGMKAVDYETGRLRNTTGLSEEQLKKLEEVEKKADPAVLHYDFNLLGQIAVLLGVSAIGGIIATYFNIPPHVGYLLGGALVGPSCLGLVRMYKEVETISLFGSIFLLFGHGAGYTPQNPDAVLKRYFIAGMAYIALTVTFVALVSVYIGWVRRIVRCAWQALLVFMLTPSMLLQSSSFLEGLIVGVAVCFTTTAPLYEHIRANQIQDSSYGRVSACFRWCITLRRS
jgi:hypothetical protein